MTEAFKQGYMDKIAEFEKEAKSTAGHELAGATLSPFILPGVGIIPSMVGSYLGSLNGRDLTEQELDRLAAKRHNWTNYIPGVASYRLAQRGGALANAIVDRAEELGETKVRPTRHTLTEALSAMNPLNAYGGAAIGSLAGALGKHRTLDEQVAHDAVMQSIKNLLIPGYAAYNSAKRLGASRDVMEHRDEKKKKKDDKDKKND